MLTSPNAIKSADRADSALAMSSWLVAMRYANPGHIRSTFTIFSNGSIIPVSNVTELQALTLAARSYALLLLYIFAYLGRAIVTSQIICDVTAVHYDAKKLSAS